MKKKFLLPFLLVFQIAFFQLISYFPELVEQLFSNSLYQKISLNFRKLFSYFPFSIGDCLYFICLIFIFYWLWKKKKSWKLLWNSNLLQIISVFSVVYFLFHLLWGLNYYREPLYKKMKINRDYSDIELLNFTKKIIQKTNETQLQITNCDSVKVVLPYSIKTIFEKSTIGYNSLSIRYHFFKYSNPCVKKSLFSLPLTYMGFGGYLNPFTNEAQVNYLLPAYSLPNTCCHEMAHQMGFASESECNFIGFLASTSNDDLYFKYSGYSLALHYCLSNWSERNPKVLKQLLPTINKGILKNFKESNDFWKSYQTPIEKVFLIIYDNFLKMNKQEEGLDSYSKFIDLLVNYYKYNQL